MKKNISHTPPIEDENISITSHKNTAAGAPAVVVSLKHAFKEMTFSNCTKTLFSVNQKDGFDCPGCAWPDPKERSKIGEYCENGVKAIAEEATTNRVTPEFFKKHSVAELSQWSDYELGKSGRITHPMILREGHSHYEAISYQEAFDYIAKELNELDSPDEAIFYTSGKATNETAFLYQLFVRQFGTNNMPDCSNMCHESSGTALSETLGIGKGSVLLEDFYVTDLIIIMGQNPGTNHPRMLSALQTAKKNKAKIIAVNPLVEAGLMNFRDPQTVSGWIGPKANLADLFLQVRINGDVALLKAIMKIMLDEEEKNPGKIFDHDFIRQKTQGFDELVADLKTVNINALSDACGISVSQIQEAAEMIIENKKIIICWAMGLTQHENGSQNVQEIVNLLLLKGSIGKPGAGTCPVRGHSNVQGDRTMGVWEKYKPEFLEKLKEHFDFEPPREYGFGTVDSIKAMADGRAKIFFGLGGNFLSATPDTNLTAQAIQNCKLTIQVSTKPNRGHLVTGKTAIILPCLGRTEIDLQKNGEQFTSVENSMGVVHSSRGQIKPAHKNLMSEPAIVAGVATATLKNSKTNWNWYVEDYDRIRDAIEKTIAGFDNFNQRVRNGGGFNLPNGARNGNFKTDSGKALFTVNEVPDHAMNDDQFMMMTIRSHDQFNTTIYGLNDRYRGIRNGRRIVLMNKKDIASIGMKAGDFVDLYNHHENIERVAPHFRIVEYDIPAKCIATYFPETNVLVPINKHDRKSHTPASKLVLVTLKRNQH